MSLCVWPAESLAGINLHAGLSSQPSSDNETANIKEDAYRVYLTLNNNPESEISFSLIDGFFINKAEAVHLSMIKLPKADLVDSNLQQVNLAGADLEGALLRFSTLEKANLWNANLSKSDLRTTNLKNTVFVNADLKEADLRAANLQAAILVGARLHDADLTKADLKNAILKDTHLSNANLTGVNFEGALIQDTDLRESKGLTSEEVDKALLCRTVLPPHIPLPPNRDCKELNIDPQTGNFTERSDNN